MPKKSHKLDGNHELPFALIAISCSDSLLKVAWNLNKALELDFRESEHQVFSKENPSQIFPVLCDRHSSESQFYSLIPNKLSSNILVKELPNIDFILEISGEIMKNDINSIIKKIKQIPGIVIALEVMPEKIKRKNAFCPV
ncbi:MAG: IPExxxVDY family protein [Tenuifilaceae bacterium]